MHLPREAGLREIATSHRPVPPLLRSDARERSAALIELGSKVPKGLVDPNCFGIGHVEMLLVQPSVQAVWLRAGAFPRLAQGWSIAQDAPE